MTINELYKLGYLILTERAIKMTLRGKRIPYTEEVNSWNLTNLFNWRSTTEGDRFWRLVSNNQMEEAALIHPHLFERKQKDSYEIF